MYNATESYKSAVRSDCRCWFSRLDFGSFNVDSTESISLTRGSQSGDGVTVGAVVAPAVRVVLTSLDRELTGRSFVWRLGVLPYERFTGENSPDDFEYIPMGEFTVRAVKRNGLRYELTCEHKLASADIPHRSALSFPTTAQALAEEVCNSMGLTFTQTFSPEIVIDALPEGALKREILSWIAALYGGFIAADRADGISVRWYGEDAFLPPANAYSAPDMGEQQISLTAVVCEGADGTYTYGQGRAMSFTCPFMTAQRFDEIAPQLAGFTYRPCKVNFLLGDPLTDTWDMLDIGYDGENCVFPVAKLTLEHKGGVTAAAEASDGSSISTERTDPITRAVNRLVKLISDNRSEVEHDIADAVEQATEAIRGGAGGYFYIVDDADGTNKETIWCDNKDPNLATHGIRINSEGIGFWVKDPADPDSSLFNGPYTQAWTIDGKLIADFIKAGILSGIEIICTKGSIGGWKITEDAIVSPDGLVRLDSTHDEPLTTHAYLREARLTHAQLRQMTHRAIRYMQSRRLGKAQISASRGADTVYMRDAALTIERSGVKQAVLDKNGLELFDRFGSRFAFWGRSDGRLLVGSGGLTGIDWVIGAAAVMSYSDGKLTVRGDLDVTDIDAGDIDAGDIAADMLRVTGRYGLEDVNDTIEKHGGLNIYSPDKRYLGGIRAVKQGDNEGIIMSILPVGAQFFGFWAEEPNGKYFESTPVIAWYKSDDTLHIHRDVDLHGQALLNADIEVTSDERLKENITPCTVDSLAVVNALQLISFDWKDGRHEDIGFSAQQAGEVSPDLMGRHGDICTVSEGRLIRYLVGAVQELSAEVERLKNMAEQE